MASPAHHSLPAPDHSAARRRPATARGPAARQSPREQQGSAARHDRPEQAGTIPAAQFDDVTGGRALRFDSWDETVTAQNLDEVLPALDRVDAASRTGRWAFGFVAYDAAAAFDPSLVTRDLRERPRPGRVPLVWFGLTATPPTLIDTAPVGTTTGRGTAAGTDDGSATSDSATGGENARGPATPEVSAVSGWHLDTSADAYAARVRAVRRAIAAGETYQCNLTARLIGQAGDTSRAGLFAYYRTLIRNQGGRDGAWIDAGRFAVASASPESFFEWRGDQVTCRPMKGTAPRGPDPAGDERQRRRLLASRKDRAENLMIVDLMRNDLSRLARPGSVQVPELFTCEKYATVWQLTSSVTGRLEPEASLRRILAALFPCGSVTGAPKPRTMALIAEQETSPRGLYCGAIGWLAPAGTGDGGAVRARFSVAIRTVVVDRATGRAEYGVGGGITWGSTPEGEFAEVQAKTAVVTDPAADDLVLIETMRAHNGRPVHLEAHLDRLRDSAAYFGFPLDEHAARARLQEAAAGPREATPAPDLRVRLTLDRYGRLAVTARPAPRRSAAPRRLALDGVPVEAQSRWLRHKTSRRALFEAAARRHPDADDTVLVNTCGQVTQTRIANLAVRLAGTWYTPPVADGCLPGVGRRLLVADGLLHERSISTAELRRADALAVVSSLRGWLPAVLLPGPEEA